MTQDEELKNTSNPEDIFPDDVSASPEEDISIQDFINRKRLQNRILGEIIEKIIKEDPHHKSQ